MATNKRIQEFLDAAEQSFQRRGFAQTTMDAVAKEAGVSVGTLYNVFQGKEDMYAQVAERTGNAVLDRLTSFVKPGNPEEAVLDVIRLRLYNYNKDRLFFQPYSFPEYLGIEPTPSQLGPRVKRLHQRYVEIIESLFARHCRNTGRGKKDTERMVVYLDGLITAFTSYWSGSIQADSLAKAAREIRDMLFRSLDADAGGTEGEAVTTVERATCVSQYDFDRLKELISVVRVFGRKEWQENADALDRELMAARVTTPREVAGDIVTMNSRVRIRDMNSGSDQVVVLVFPRDLHTHESHVCILDQLGLAVFGRRLRDRFEVHGKRGISQYILEEILYQPEAAGDFEL